MAGGATGISIDPLALGTSLSTVYTVPTGKVAILKQMLFCNTDTVSRWVEWHIVPSGSPSATNKIRHGAAASGIPASDTERWDMVTLMGAGSTIQLKAEAASVMSCRVSVMEGVDSDLKPVAPLLVTTALQTIHTVPAGETHLLTEMILCNQHTAAVQVDVYAVNSGGSAAVATQIRRNATVTALPAADTEIWSDGLLLEAGSTIQLKGDAGSVVSARVSLVRTS